MSIHAVQQSGFHARAALHGVGKEKGKQTEERLPGGVSDSQAGVSTDRYTHHPHPEITDALTYEPPKKLSAEQIEKLEQQLHESMRDLAYKMLGAQADKAKRIETMSTEELAEVLGMGTTPETAEAAIAEDGMWGVDAVATRLMDFAMQLAKGNPALAGELRDAVKVGFEAVGDIDSLPQVCQDTYAETMKRFDYWEEHGSMDGYGQTPAEPDPEQ